MTEEEMGRVLAVYYSIASSLEILHNYCQRHIEDDYKKEFHTPTENYCYKNLMNNIKGSKYWLERYSQEAYKLTAYKNDDKELKELTQFELIDNSIKTGIGYTRFILLFYNVVANCVNIKIDLMKFESNIKLFIKKWFIPQEVIDEFKHFD